MKLGIREYPDGWRLGVYKKGFYFLRRLNKQQAERALNLFNDTPIDWVNLPGPLRATENERRIIACLTILVSKEFDIPLSELVTSDPRYIALIEKQAEQRPK